MTGREAQRRPRALAEMLRATGALGAAVCATGGLAGATHDLGLEVLAGGAMLTPGGLEAAVALAVTGVGTLAAAVLSVGCLLLVVAAAARTGGAALVGVERVAARLTPRLLRRVLALGVGGLLVAGPAAAAVPDPAGPDLGWTVSTSAGRTAAPASGATAASAPTSAPPGLGSGAGSGATATDPASAVPTTLPVAPGLGPAAAPVTASPAGLPSAPAPAPALRLPAGAPGAATVPAGAASPTVPAAPPATGATARTAVPAGPAGTDAGAADHVVVAGESLWSVAATHLGPDATDAEIAAAWPRWYAANAAVVGDDPDLVLPGQVLRAPTVVPTASAGPAAPTVPAVPAVPTETTATPSPEEQP